MFPINYLPQKLLQMKDEAFFKIYDEVLKQKDISRKDAYQLVENIHERFYHERRYSSYNAFRVVYNRKVKTGKI